MATQPGHQPAEPAAPDVTSRPGRGSPTGRLPAVTGHGPALDDRGVESRAGCHCATLAHRALRLDPLASCRLSFALYNTVEDVDRAVGAVAEIVDGACHRPKSIVRYLR